MLSKATTIPNPADTATVMIDSVKRTESGWPGHHICALSCVFHRTTFLTLGDITIVVSTVGAYIAESMRGKNQDFETVGLDRYYETMAFDTMDGNVERDGCTCSTADVGRQITFDADWWIDKPYAPDSCKADAMHEAVVAELTAKLEQGVDLWTSRDRERDAGGDDAD
jgi:hypothetical protein